MSPTRSSGIVLTIITQFVKLANWYVNKYPTDCAPGTHALQYINKHARQQHFRFFIQGGYDYSPRGLLTLTLSFLTNSCLYARCAAANSACLASIALNSAVGSVRYSFCTHSKRRQAKHRARARFTVRFLYSFAAISTWGGRAGRSPDYCCTAF